MLNSPPPPRALFQGDTGPFPDFCNYVLKNDIENAKKYITGENAEREYGPTAEFLLQRTCDGRNIISKMYHEKSVTLQTRKFILNEMAKHGVIAEALRTPDYGEVTPLFFAAATEDRDNIMLLIAHYDSSKTFYKACTYHTKFNRHRAYNWTSDMSIGAMLNDPASFDLSRNWYREKFGGEEIPFAPSTSPKTTTSTKTKKQTKANLAGALAVPESSSKAKKAAPKKTSGKKKTEIVLPMTIE